MTDQQRERRFPHGFLWGSATAAHQVEGSNYNSDCWALEQTTPSLFREPSGDAADHWNRFDDDVAVLAAIGLGSYRFSIEWARIEPEEGRFSQVALDHYQRCIDACLERGVRPMITFHHFTSPKWLAADGGMTNPAFVGRFARYCEKATRSLAGFDLACTINELNVPLVIRELVQRLAGNPDAAIVRDAAEAALGGPLSGVFLFTPPEQIVANGLAAHAAGRDAIKGVRPDIQVGLTLALQDEQAEPGGEEVRDRRRGAMIDPFLDAVRGDDFIGVQNYTRVLSRANGSSGPAPDHPITMMGHEDRPQALAEVCRYVWDRIATPIVVTENGWAGDDDRRRSAFIEEALGHLQVAIDEGVDVRGYYYWSLLDNFEWIAGYGPRFGLLSVDRETQRRTLKPSATAFGAIAKDNEIGKKTAQPYGGIAPDTALTGSPLGI